MKILCGALLAALVLPALGCSSSGEFVAALPAPSALAGHTWTLVELGGESFVPQAGATAPFVNFDTESGRVSGHAGCNRFFGNVIISGASLSFDALGATRMACPEPIAGLETRFLAALGSTDGFRMEGADLLLVAGDRDLARFR